jgi:hypothetical protein
MGGRSGFWAALALALAGPAAAQGPTAAPAAPAGCEFHAWPGDGLMSVFHGWLHGGTVNGQIQGRPGYPTVPPDPLSPATQAEVLAETQPQRLLRHPDYRLIVHEEALPSRTIRAARNRLTESASPCYAELIVDDVVLQQDYVNGSKLKILFRYRDFGPSIFPDSFATWVEVPLAAFPPRGPEQLNAALAEIRQAFRQNIGRFAIATLRPRRRR